MPQPGHAQGRLVPPPDVEDTHATVAPGPRYEAGAFQRWLLGSGWRELWTAPVRVPVLHIDTFAGGLEPEKEGGNMQSITLHMEDAQGRDWIFRSIDKYPEEKLGIGGLAEDLVQDQIGMMHPAGQLVVPPLLDALGILHVEPRFYILPDDPALGEFRERFAGMIGSLELQPDEGEDDTPGFAGSTKIIQTGTLYERLEENPIHSVAERELVRARLLDFIIGDTDRPSDQWRWARFEDPERPGRIAWRPIPRDRDWTFINADGLLLKPFRGSYPKLTTFGPEYPSLEPYVFSSHTIDRWLLTETTREEIEAEVSAVQRLITDELIEGAVDRLPEEYPAAHREELAEALRGRRATLPELAAEWYAWMASEVDIRGTDAADRATLTRRPDGSLEVVMAALPGGEAGNAGDDDALPVPPGEYYRRVFHPAETNEVRVFLHGDDDTAVVRGPSDAIRVRVIGGGGDDVLADSSGAGAVHLYDARGDNRFVRSRGTRVDERSWDPPPTPEGVRIGSDWAPDWGGGFSVSPHAAYGEYAGISVGVGLGWTDYGFRRLPHHWSLGITPMYATGANRFGVALSGDYRLENSLHSAQLEASWIDFDGIRWYGLGNATPMVDDDLSLVPLTRARIQPAMVLRFGRWRERVSETEESLSAIDLEAAPPAGLRVSLEMGPLAEYVDARPREGSPFLTDRPDDPERDWQGGARAALSLDRVDQPGAPRSGFRATAAAEGFAGALDTDGAFGELMGELDLYVPLPASPFLALRLGGMQALGEEPAWHTPRIGGRATLRGYEFNRFAGERAAYGSAELRVPLGRIEWITRGEIGILGLYDAGRVWVDDASPGGWHTAYGGGVWLTVLRQALTVTYAEGEEGLLYLSLGLPF